MGKEQSELDRLLQIVTRVLSKFEPRQKFAIYGEMSMSVLQDFSSVFYSKNPTILSRLPSKEESPHPESSAATSKEPRPIQVIYPNGLTYEGISTNGSLLGRGRIIQRDSKKIIEANFQPNGKVIINAPHGITKTCQIIKGALVTERVRFPSGDIFTGKIENEDLGEELFSGEGELINLSENKTYNGKFVRGKLEDEEKTLPPPDNSSFPPAQWRKTKPATKDFPNLSRRITHKKKLGTIREISREGKSRSSVIARTEASSSEMKRSPKDRKEEEFEERRRIERDKILIAEVEKRRRSFAQENSLNHLSSRTLQQPVPPTTEKRSVKGQICSFFHRIHLYK